MYMLAKVALGMWDQFYQNFEFFREVKNVWEGESLKRES